MAFSDSNSLAGPSAAFNANLSSSLAVVKSGVLNLSSTAVNAASRSAVFAFSRVSSAFHFVNEASTSFKSLSA